MDLQHFKRSRMFLFFILEVFVSVALSRNLLHLENNSGILHEYSISKGINPIQPVPQPSKNRSCNAQKCPPEWKIGEWEECSATCERGIQYRMVYCQQITNEDTPTVVNKNLCLKLVGPRPQHVRPCNQHIRCPHWSVGPWSTCNKMCGPGERTRSVTCQKIINDEILVFPEENCGLHERPQSKQKCQDAPCEGVDWIASDSSRVSSDYLCKLNCTATWMVSLWSKCSAKCGTGNQTRHVFCGIPREYSIKKVPEKQCDSKKKLRSVKKCTSKPCNGVWFSGQWNECSAPCGGGVRTRKVLCITGIEIVDELSCDSKNKPFVNETCNTNPCDSDEVISIDGCKDSENECCPDNVTRAGPDLSGCPTPVPTPQKGCEASEFGCCPDGETAALGPFKKGCSKIFKCEDTKHGCCHDGISAAKGPNNEGCPDPCCGCQVTPYGCCPDEKTPAEGTNYTGCPCSSMPFGCCPDNTTTAQGENYLGCDCQTTRFGCCPDGKTPSPGHNQEGCEKMLADPSNVPPTAPTIKVGKVCGLPSDEGSCSDHSVKWFFDVKYGECDRFWYSGCKGNGNRFDTEEECEEVCIFPEGMGACYLPPVSGSCHSPTIMWYYDDTSGQCSQFYYNGCLGNNNRFATQEKCEKTCSVTKTIGKKPRIEPTSDELRVRVNHSVHIPCIARGEPRPYIYWRKDGKDLAIDDVKLYFINDQLRITNVQQSDEGEYTCIADNGYGTPAERTTQVIVEEPARILPGLRAIVVVEGSPCLLRCNAIGYPRPTVTWWRKHIMLPLLSKQYEQFSNYSLLIRSVTKNDYGDYSCMATNGIGEPVEQKITVRAAENYNAEEKREFFN